MAGGECEKWRGGGAHTKLRGSVSRFSGGAMFTNGHHRSSAYVAPVTLWHTRKIRAEKKGTRQQETADLVDPAGRAHASPAQTDGDAKLP